MEAEFKAQGLSQSDITQKMDTHAQELQEVRPHVHARTGVAWRWWQRFYVHS